jgi:hypothetical protein
MAMPLHEPVGELPEEARDLHRALSSLIEELEAVNWYHQRAAATPSADLRGILIHNRNEEMEHAAMLLEWLRRISPDFDEHLRTYLFTQGDLLAVEEAAEAAENDDGDGGKAQPTAGGASGAGLGIGSLRKGRRSTNG